MNMNRMAFTVVDQLDLLFRPFTAVFHRDSILSSSLAKGLGRTLASVVSIRALMEAAFWRAERVTLVGSTTPDLTKSSY
jgi:hypothetical protein